MARGAPPPPGRGAAGRTGRQTTRAPASSLSATAAPPSRALLRACLARGHRALPRAERSVAGKRRCVWGWVGRLRVLSRRVARQVVQRAGAGTCKGGGGGGTIAPRRGQARTHAALLDLSSPAGGTPLHARRRPRLVWMWGAHAGVAGGPPPTRAGGSTRRHPPPLPWLGLPLSFIVHRGPVSPPPPRAASSGWLTPRPRGATVTAAAAAATTTTPCSAPPLPPTPLRNSLTHAQDPSAHVTLGHRDGPIPPPVCRGRHDRRQPRPTPISPRAASHPSRHLQAAHHRRW